MTVKASTRLLMIALLGLPMLALADDNDSRDLNGFRAISVGGGSHAVFDKDFSGDDLVLRASGGSNLRFKGKVISLDVVTSGGSDVSLEGSAHMLKARSSGGSDIVVTVHDKLTARASGGSSIRYEGHPKDTDIKSGGGGRVRAR